MATPSETGGTLNGGMSRREWALAALFFVASVLLAAAGARGDLAIDEVVSLNKALGVQHWAELFTQYQNDNNHLLNTLFMRAIGETRHLFLYRIPALLFGAALLPLLMVTSRRLGNRLPVWVACLSGLSYPMVLYSSEARGYLPALFFAVLAYELIQQCWEGFAVWKLLMFWAALGLGILAHFSFIMVCLALGVWCLAHDYWARVPLRAVIGNAVRYFAVPLVFLAGLYLVYIRHMRVLGGNPETRWDTISDTALYLLGFSPEDVLRLPGVALMLVLVAGAVWKLIRRRRQEWIFFIAILFLAPAFVILVWRPSILYFRYFSVSFPFFYLLLAYLLAGWSEQGGKMRLLAVALAATITTGHLVKIAGLIHYGRGNYSAALRAMAAATPGPVIRVSSDHDFRNGTLLEFYARFLPNKQVEYIPRPRRDAETPDWFIEHCLNPTFPPYPDVEVGGIGKYDLFGVYPFCGSSGWSWFVYLRIPPSASTNAATARPPAAAVRPDRR